MVPELVALAYVTSLRRSRAPAPTEVVIEASIASATVLGDRANLLIVREAFRRTRRYQEFKDRLGMSDAVLSSRLRDLVEVGVLRTVRYLDHPPRNEYRLTDPGIDFWQTAIGIWMWEKRWATRRHGRLPELTHLTCGAVTTAEFGCGHCSKPGVSARDLTVDTDHAIGLLSGAPLRRYRRASWKPSQSIDLYSEIDGLLGDRWNLATVGAAMIGVSRFGEFQRALDVSPPLLSQRLSDLVDRDVLQRVTLPGGGAHHRYRLRQKGWDLTPILACNFAWGRRWYPVPAGPPLSIKHHACGDDLLPAWFCASCREVLVRNDITFDIYPPSTPSRP